jgi:HAD superfamily hydrolase (TIGR01490 family)
MNSAAATPIRLAIYDMDRTITVRATFTPFLLHSAWRLQPLRLLFVPIVLLAMLGFACRLYDRARLKEMMQTLLIGPLTPAQLAKVKDSFAAATDRNNIRPGARERLRTDKADGYRLVMATASYRLYAEAVGQRMGFDDVIATNTLVGLDNRVMARIDGENCYGPGKMRMVEAWLAMHGLRREDCYVRFYSDHISDAPLFGWADEAYATNPHATLRTLARSMKWSVFDW